LIIPDDSFLTSPPVLRKMPPPNVPTMVPKLSTVVGPGREYVPAKLLTAAWALSISAEVEVAEPFVIFPPASNSIPNAPIGLHCPEVRDGRGQANRMNRDVSFDKGRSVGARPVGDRAPTVDIGSVDDGSEVSDRFDATHPANYLRRRVRGIAVGDGPAHERHAVYEIEIGDPHGAGAVKIAIESVDAAGIDDRRAVARLQPRAANGSGACHC
jgi:hypothetical protein